MTQAELCVKIGIPHKRLGSYEENRAEPDLYTSVIIADFFQVDLKDMVTTKITKAKRVKTISYE